MNTGDPLQTSTRHDQHGQWPQAGSVEEFRHNLAAVHARIAAADGAFYLWCDVGELTQDSLAFCSAMLDGAGVAATPGVDFDPARGGRFVRFSYCGDTAAVMRAPERLRAWLAARAA